jgi:hypothetical protein
MSSLFMNRLPVALADPLSGALVRLAVGDLEPYGLRRPKIGPVRLVRERNRIPVVDVGTLALIKQGKIRVVGGVERFTESGVTLSAEGRLDVDAVVLATGYKPALAGFLAGAEDFVDGGGYPTQHGTNAKGRGIFFIGFRNPTIGQLNDIGLEARRIAAAIASPGSGP